MLNVVLTKNNFTFIQLTWSVHGVPNQHQDKNQKEKSVTKNTLMGNQSLFLQPRYLTKNNKDFLCKRL